MAEEKRVFNEKEDGITFGENTWMVAGYIKDFVKKDDEGKITECNFKDKVGYVDEKDQVHIFMIKPELSDIIPWFTFDHDKFELVFNDYHNTEIDAAFNVSRVQSMNINVINAMSQGVTQLYNKQAMQEMMNASSDFIPEIKDKDDFLKKLVKTVILQKKVNPHLYKNEFEKSYIITNLISGLQNETKLNPFTFGLWMQLLQCDFTVTIKDAGTDDRFPLKDEINYDSQKNLIEVKGEKDEDKKYAISAKQFAD